MSKLYKDKEWLYTEYIKKDKSSEQIARDCGVGGQTILNWLHKFEIPRRETGVRSAATAKKLYETKCVNCGEVFYVDMPCKADPKNERKFIRACSKECTSALRSSNMRRIQSEGRMNHHTGLVTMLKRDDLIRMICYEHMYYADIAKQLRVKTRTLAREIKRLNVPRKFYRQCPQCDEYFSCKMRCQVDESSSKFKKFCSHSCFLKSRSKTDTWIERVTNAYLTENNIKFIPQYSIGRMTADFYIPAINLVVEANGDFWHANPTIYTNKESLHPIQRRAIEKDARKIRQLYDKGYDVFILWENDLNTKQGEVLGELLTYIRSKEVTNGKV